VSAHADGSDRILGLTWARKSRLLFCRTERTGLTDWTGLLEGEMETCVVAGGREVEMEMEMEWWVASRGFSAGVLGYGMDWMDG